MLWKGHTFTKCGGKEEGGGLYQRALEGVHNPHRSIAERPPTCVLYDEANPQSQNPQLQAMQVARGFYIEGKAVTERGEEDEHAGAAALPGEQRGGQERRLVSALQHKARELQTQRTGKTTPSLSTIYI